jgi:hypothetical protein
VDIDREWNPQSLRAYVRSDKPRVVMVRAYVRSDKPRVVMVRAADDFVLAQCVPSLLVSFNFHHGHWSWL